MAGGGGVRRGTRADRHRDPHWPGGTRGPLRRPLFPLAGGHALPAAAALIGRGEGGGARAARCSAPPAPPRSAPPALTGRVGGPGSCRGAEVEGHGADRGAAGGGPRRRRVRAPAAGPAANKTGRTSRFFRCRRRQSASGWRGRLVVTQSARASGLYHRGQRGGGGAREGRTVPRDTGE